MFWGGNCATGKTLLIFVDVGVKVNQNVYLRDILEAVALPWSNEHFGDQQWTFQQDSAPAHRPKTVQQWCVSHFLGFISARKWPPYSPDLNPMDYSVWSVLEAKACAKPHKSLESLNRSLLTEWDKISVKELRKIVKNFMKPLKLCIEAKGGHFENH